MEVCCTLFQFEKPHEYLAPIFVTQPRQLSQNFSFAHGREVYQEPTFLTNCYNAVSIFSI